MLTNSAWSRWRAVGESTITNTGFTNCAADTNARNSGTVATRRSRAESRTMVGVVWARGRGGPLCTPEGSKEDEDGTCNIIDTIVAIVNAPSCTCEGAEEDDSASLMWLLLDSAICLSSAPCFLPMSASTLARAWGSNNVRWFILQIMWRM